MQNTPNLGPLERRIEMSVPLALINQETTERLKRLSRTVKVPGFRPGKAPMNIVAQQYGRQAQIDATDAAVNKVLNDKLREGQYRVAGQPRIQEGQASDAEHIHFEAVFEVYPDVTPGDLSGVEIKHPTLEVTAADLEKTLDTLRKQRMTYVEVSRAAAKDDRVVVDFLGTENGTPFEGGQATDYPFIIGAGRMLADFEAAATGLSKGESRRFDLTFPDDYQARQLAGKTVQFEITLKAVEEPRLPELDSDFAKALGVADGSVEALRADIEANLKREVKRRLTLRAKEAAFNALLEATPIDVPAALVHSAAQNMAQKAREDMAQRGMDVKSMPIDPTWFLERATHQVKLGLVVSEVIKLHQLYATDEQVREMVEDFAQSYEDPQQMVSWYYAEPGRLREVQAAVAEENVVKWILNQAKTVETPLSFDELMGASA